MTEPLTPKEEARVRESVALIAALPVKDSGLQWTNDAMTRLLATLDRVRAEATAAAEQRLAGLREALRTLSDVGWVLARITPEGERIAPPDDAWHDLDEALEQARALLDTPPSASPRQGEPVDVERDRTEVLRLALHRIAYSQESDLSVYAKFAAQTAKDAMLANLEGSCAGCGNAIHRGEDHPDDDDDRACVRCTCSRYELWPRAALSESAEP